MKMFAVIRWVFLTLIVSGATSADSGLRTDINPALIYAQATLEMPDRAGQDHLFTNEWRGRELDEPFNKQIVTYDAAFKLLRQAARQKAVCDWGYDLTLGPELLLPGLAKAKLLTLAARLRVRWHLENGRPDDARDDLLAAFILGRQVSRDSVLISALVQLAIENILVAGIAENWFRFSPETLQQVLEGIAAAPVRGTIAQCVGTERIAFKDWLTRRIGEIQSSSPSEAEALQKTRALLHSMMSGGDAPEEPGAPSPEAIIQAAGGTTTGLLGQLKQLDELYDEAAVLMTAPYEQYLPGIKAFNEKVARHPNLLVKVFFPVFYKCRLKEFGGEEKLAILRAASEYRRLGEAGLSQVQDPLFNEPFQFRRFEFAGVDRGFELVSKFRYLNDWNSSLIFLSGTGPRFIWTGKTPENR